MQNLKICVASRAWSNFEDTFRGRASLMMLQDLSAADIEYYVSSTLAANQGFSELHDRDPSNAKELSETIAKKAEGVFLWVCLVVQSLFVGLTNGYYLRGLHNRLQELPPNLEDLYTKILKSLNPKYLAHASRLSQVVRACEDSLTLFLVTLADFDDETGLVMRPVRPISNRDKSALCKNMKRKLVSRCRGLFDISFHMHYTQHDSALGRGLSQGPDNDSNNFTRAIDDDQAISAQHIAGLEVQ
ncbi:hypothetical protein QBC36DRAFT_193690 [Triangularia setosa]|uniref:DUF7791 domain-containing protein n=1 Tax=Triangularia setosa TaxID=2587417 RepID=A0AAN6W2L7_9PEZI|nr:hypothetical protein QBC36DRAFT_193690 [Podospora setosa]